MNSQTRLEVSEIHHVGQRNGASLFYAGWAGFALFGLMVFIDGNADLAYAVIHVAVAAAICAWYAMTAGKTAPIVGAVLGALFAIQMVFFLLSDISGSAAIKTTLEDTFGLLAAVFILGGAALTLLGRRSATNPQG